VVGYAPAESLAKENGTRKETPPITPQTGLGKERARKRNHYALAIGLNAVRFSSSLFRDSTGGEFWLLRSRCSWVMWYAFTPTLNSILVILVDGTKRKTRGE